MKLKIVFIIVLTIIFLVPIVWTINLAFMTQNQMILNPISIPSFLYFDNFLTAMRYVDIPLVFFNSIFIALVSTFLALLMTSVSSYALARFTLKGRKTQDFIYSLFLSGLAIPVFVLIFPIYWITFSVKLSDNYIGVILPYLALSLSFNTLVFTGAIRSLMIEMEEAAIIDGCNVLRLIFTIVLPVLKPVLYTVFIFDLLGALKEFPLASIIINKESMKTIALSIMKFRGLYSSNMAGTAAYVVIILVPQLIFYSFFQKYIVAGMTAGSIKA